MREGKIVQLGESDTCLLYTSIMSDGYNAYVFIGNELKSARSKDTVHQVCMSHAKNKFVKASNQGGEPVSYTHL